MKKVILIFIPLSVISLITTAFLFLNTATLKSQLLQSKTMIQKTQEELQRLQSDKEKIIGEKDKLKADAVSYVALNTKIQDEQERLQKSKEGMEKLIKVKEKELKATKQKIQELVKALEKKKDELSNQDKVFKERDNLRKKIISLDTKLKQERALYHYNLGVAYSQAKFYDEAVGEYKESLKYNPSNPDAYYNLGLLYEDVKQDSVKAVEYFQKYLELKPDAKDKREVTGWIKKLKRPSK